MIPPLASTPSELAQKQRIVIHDEKFLNSMMRKQGAG